MAHSPTGGPPRSAAFDVELARLIADSPHNLVSTGDRPRVGARHIPEAHRLAEVLGPVEGRWLDLGTGGGLPGLVLAYRCARAEWTLVDATAKKAEEVRRFRTALGVPCEVVTGRAEELARDPRFRGGFDGVVARAVASLAVLVELARGFLPDGGALVAVKGARWEKEAEDAREALSRTSMELAAAPELGIGDARAVWVRARGQVPDAVPRRAGVPGRRPW